MLDLLNLIETLLYFISQVQPFTVAVSHNFVHAFSIYGKIFYETAQETNCNKQLRKTVSVFGDCAVLIESTLLASIATES